MRTENGKGGPIRLKNAFASQPRCLDMSGAEYVARAMAHAPKTAEEIMQAAKDLAAAGFSDYTVAAILRADVNVVRRLIGERH